MGHVEEIETRTKLTEADIEAMIEREMFMRVGAKTTVVLITLKNGFEVVGTSACVDPSTYNLEIGTHFARKRALDKIWELEGYLLQTKMFVPKEETVLNKSDPT